MRDVVFLCEKFLELVNDQQRPGHRLGATRPFVTGDVLRAQFAEQIAAAAQFLVHALQHAQSKLAVAFNGHHLGVRQPAVAVALELDAFLEVHEIELDLLRAAPAWTCRSRSCRR